jgi:hypothetical protein
MRTELVRSEIARLIRQAPFCPFALNMENGDRVIIEHPENIAFSPGYNGSRGSTDFYVLSDSLRIYSTFDAVSSVALLDTGEQAG